MFVEVGKNVVLVHLDVNAACFDILLMQQIFLNFS